MKNKGFLGAYKSIVMGDIAVLAGGFPVTGFGSAISARASWVFSVDRREEVPFGGAGRAGEFG
jgi:hypothetical protein